MFQRKYFYLHYFTRILLSHRSASRSNIRKIITKVVESKNHIPSMYKVCFGNFSKLKDHVGPQAQNLFHIAWQITARKSVVRGGGPRWSTTLREFDSYREYSKQSGSMDNKVVGRIHLSQQWWLIISNKSRVLAALRGWWWLPQERCRRHKPTNGFLQQQLSP